MKIKQYDRVRLKDGNEASIVEILKDNRAFIADIDKDGDTSTEFVDIEEIEVVLW